MSLRSCNKHLLLHLEGSYGIIAGDSQLNVYQGAAMKVMAKTALLIFLLQMGAHAQEGMPVTSSIMLKAYAAENLCVEHIAHIPIYGYMRKIACPVINEGQTRVRYIKTIADLLLARRYKWHVPGNSLCSITINSDKTVSYIDEQGNELKSYQLPCLNTRALDELISLAEQYNYIPTDGFTRNQEIQLTKIGLYKFFTGNKQQLSLYCFTPGDEMLYDLASQAIADIQIIKPLTQKQFELLTDDLTEPYNSGIDVKNCFTMIQPKPLDIELLKRIKKLVD